MAILDAFNEFSDSQDVDTDGTVGTNTFDTKSTEDIGVGEPITIEFSVDTAATAAGAATVQFDIVDDDNAALSSPAILASSAAIAKATLVAGYKIRVSLPAGVQTQRYLGVQYTIATGPLTAGNFSAYVVQSPQANTTYVDHGAN